MKVFKWLSLVISIVLFSFIPRVNDRTEEILDSKQQLIELKESSNSLVATYRYASKEVIDIIERYKLVDKDINDENYHYNITFMNDKIQDIGNKIRKSEEKLCDLLYDCEQWDNLYAYTHDFRVGYHFSYINDVVYDYSDFADSTEEYVNTTMKLQEELTDMIFDYNDSFAYLKTTNYVLYGLSSLFLILFICLNFKQYNKKIRIIISTGLGILLVAGFISTVALGSKLKKASIETTELYDVNDKTNNFLGEYYMYVMYNSFNTSSSSSKERIKTSYQNLQDYYTDIINSTSNEELKSILTTRLSDMKNKSLVLDIENKVEAEYKIKEYETLTKHIAIELNKEYAEVEEVITKQNIHTGDSTFIENYRKKNNTIYSVQKTISSIVYAVIALDIFVSLGLKVKADLHKHEEIEG